MSHGVGLVAHEHTVARRARVFPVTATVVEGETDDAFNALTGIHVFLYGDLVGGSLFEDATQVSVNAFGVFADDNKIHIGGPDRFERAQGLIEKAHGAHIGKQIHLKAHTQQNVAGMNVGRDAGITKSAAEDGVKVAGKSGKAVWRHGDAVGEIAICSPIEGGELD